MICLTFDTDHMSQEDMIRFLGEYKIPGTATFFTHQYFPFLDSTHHEICPHPFIRDVSDWEENLIKMVKQFKRQPKGIRMHSCLSSHMIEIALHKMGYKYVSNMQYLFQTGLIPNRHPWGIWELPIYYMDNMDFWMPLNWPKIGHKAFNPDIIGRAIYNEGLYIFDIHPLHVALNTSSHEGYCQAREKILTDKKSPYELRSNGRGVADFFEELCSSIEDSDQRSFSCMEALEFFCPD